MIKSNLSVVFSYLFVIIGFKEVNKKDKKFFKDLYILSKVKESISDILHTKVCKWCFREHLHTKVCKKYVFLWVILPYNMTLFIMIKSTSFPNLRNNDAELIKNSHNIKRKYERLQTHKFKWFIQLQHQRTTSYISCGSVCLCADTQ